MHNPSRKKGTSGKLHSPWTGPFLVVGKVSDLLYQIQQSRKAKKKFVHHDRLKPAFQKLPSWLPYTDVEAGVQQAVPVGGAENGGPRLCIPTDEVTPDLSTDKVTTDLSVTGDPINDTTFQIPSTHTVTQSGRRVKPPQWYGECHPSNDM